MMKARDIAAAEVADSAVVIRLMQYGLVLLCAAITLLPYVWMVSSSF